MTQAYTIYTAQFKDGYEITASSFEFDNRLGFYNWICQNRIGKKHGELLSITCRPMHI